MMKITKTRLMEIIKKETEKILHGEPLEIQLLQRVLDPRDKMTPEEAKKRLPIELHKKFDYYLAKNKKLQNREALPQEPEEVPGLEEKKMKLTKTRLMEIIKEETISLVKEDDISIQRVTDIDQMVKNFLTTASMPKGGGEGESREEFFRNNINKIVQYIINGEIYHYFIPDGLFVNAEDKEVEDDSIWAKMAPMFDKIDAAGSSGMKPPVPQMPKLKNITIHSSGEHAVLRMDGFQGRSKDEIKNYLMNLHIYPDKIGDGVVVFDQGKRSFREFFMDLKDIDNDWSYRDENGALEEQKIKLTKTRLMEIIKEKVIKEVSTEKARRYMCAMKDKEADERPDGLSQDDAEEMCHAPLKEEELEEGWFGFGDKTKKQTKKTDAMTQFASDTLDRFSGEKVKKPKPSPDEELQQMSDKKKQMLDKKKSDDDLLALKKKMGLAEKKKGNK